MITSFEDFCLWTYVLIDDCWQQLAPLDRRPGPLPVCSDAELVTMALIGECKGWDEETVLLSEWSAHRELFPRQPTRTRFNRRRRQLQGAINEVRRLLLAMLDFAQDRQCVLDSLPVPVIRFHLVPKGARASWQSSDARFGKVPSKSITIFGYKLYLLVTRNGVILDFVLAPANVMELQAGIELLEEHTDLEVLGDKAFVSAPLQARLLAENRLTLRTLPRRNQQVQVPPEETRAFNAARQIIETVNSQLAEQFGIEVNHAQSFQGLTARLISKLTAHTLSLALNRLLGAANVLQIKALAFPNPF
jgi:Transposase DDE domain